MRHSLRFCLSICLIVILILILPWKPKAATANQLVFIMGGDVEYSRASLEPPRPPTVLYHIDDLAPYGQLRDVRDQVIGDWPLVPYLNEGESKAYVEGLGLEGLSSRPGTPIWGTHTPTRPESINKHPSPNEESFSNPLQGLAPTLHAADLVFFNLEGPLSNRARRDGGIRSPEKLAADLRSVGATVVTVANNHSFDSQEQGFLDTLRVLSAAGLLHVGGGHDLEEARKPVIFERNGIKVGILGYAQFSNMGEAAFAAYERPGIAPMDPFLIKEDIRRLRSRVDYVAVTMHSATNSGTYKVSPENRKFAHDLIDAGADLFLGHHPPHPKGIEVYRGKVIIYSPSVTLRGASVGGRDAVLKDTPDNYLVRFTLGAKSVEKVEVLPIAGKGQQPFPLEGSRAQQLLEAIRGRCAELDTAMTIDGDKGIITIPPTSN
jgi:poly-gamma-glutamate capsule biosynthesis protein CapA/YwtB (metallophosphatase superfamily)